MSRSAGALSIIRAGRARVVEEMFIRKLDQHHELDIYLEILAPQLNNSSEEIIFGSNKIKDQHETMKL